MAGSPNQMAQKDAARALSLKNNEGYAAHDLMYHTGPEYAKPHMPSGEPGNDFERPAERANQDAYNNKNFRG